MKKLKERFGLDHVVLVGDRGMITQARIDAGSQSRRARLDHRLARAGDPRRCARAARLQLSLFDERDMAAITAPEFPGERLIVCRNPVLAAERARKREELLAATERDLARIAARRRAQAPAAARQGARSAWRSAPCIDKHKMAKHFDLDITDTSFAFTRKTAQIAAGGRARRPLCRAHQSARRRARRRRHGRALQIPEPVERAFRCLKTVDLQIRPVYHWLAERVRAHVFLCMLAYYLEWHMRQRWRRCSTTMTDKEAAEALRASVVAKAERSPAAVAKQTTGRTEDGLPVHSFRTLLADLATLTRNTLVTALAPEQPFSLTARPTPLQQKAYDLLALSCTQ